VAANGVSGQWPAIGNIVNGWRQLTMCILCGVMCMAIINGPIIGVINGNDSVSMWLA